MVLAATNAIPEMRHCCDKQPSKYNLITRQLSSQPGSVAHLLSGDRKTAISGCLAPHSGCDLRPHTLWLWYAAWLAAAVG